LSPRPRAYAVTGGVDEAGLGPVLGPLTIGFSVFRAPQSSRNLWRTLEPSVSREICDDERSFVVADSKQVFQRTPRCSGRLETTALGFLALLEPSRKPPGSMERILWGTPASLAPAPGLAERLPWYERIAARAPRFVDAGLLEIRVELLWRRMRRRFVEMLDAGVCVLPEDELNRSFGETENKALTHWHKSAAVLRYLWERFAAHGLELVVDRHGGRFYYGDLLAQTFPEAAVECVLEKASRSDYRIAERGAPEASARRMYVIFAERAENRSFPVALASCLAKYAREACMEGFNAYFGDLEPALRPTAGYHGDAWRWLREAAPVLERAGVDARRLVRLR
jgi:ribonuclease HII